jgi:hypothetical protein
LARETEIAKLHDAIFANQQVFRFNVAMNDVVRVQKVVCLQDLVNDFLNLVDMKSTRRKLQLFKERFFDVVKD